MSRRRDVDTSYSLEHRLAQSIDRMRENLVRSHAMRQQILKLRRQRRQLEAVPEEVRQWFEDTAEYLEEEEEEEGE